MLNGEHSFWGPPAREASFVSCRHNPSNSTKEVRVILRFQFLVPMTLALVMSLSPGAVTASTLLLFDTQGADRVLAHTEAAGVFRRGIQALLDRDHAEAEKAFSAAAVLEPRSAAPLIGLAEVARVRGNPSEARALLTKARELEPEQPAVHLAYGRFLRNQGEFVGAEAALRESTRIEGASGPGLLELADLYLELRRPGESATLFSEALELRPDEAFVHYGLGVALSMLGRTDEAMVALRQATELAPRDPAPLQALARLHAERTDWDHALSRIDSALELAPHSPSMRLDRSEWLAARGDVAEGIAAAEAVSADFPELSEAHFRRANLLLRAGHWEPAEMALRQTVKYDSSNPMALNNLAYLLADRDAELGDALGYALRAVELAPSNPFFVHTLGRVYKARGDAHEAASAFRNVTETIPDYADGHYHLGIVQMEINELRAAERSLERALELGVSEDQRADALRRLALLRDGR